MEGAWDSVLVGDSVETEGEAVGLLLGLPVGWELGLELGPALGLFVVVVVRWGLKLGMGTTGPVSMCNPLGDVDVVSSSSSSSAL